MKELPASIERDYRRLKHFESIAEFWMSELYHEGDSESQERESVARLQCDELWKKIRRKLIPGTKFVESRKPQRILTGAFGLCDSAPVYDADEVWDEISRREVEFQGAYSERRDGVEKVRSMWGK